MGGKGKKGGGKGKGKGSAPAEEDDSVDKFWKFYKKKVVEYEVPVNPIIKERYEMFTEEQEIPTRFHIWTELGWAGARAIMDALREVKYQHCVSIRLWKTFCEDEGVRSVCQYLEHGRNVAFLELLDNNITPLGCEFLSKALHPKN